LIAGLDPRLTALRRDSGTRLTATNTLLYKQIPVVSHAIPLYHRNLSYYQRTLRAKARVKRVGWCEPWIGWADVGCGSPSAVASTQRKTVCVSTSHFRVHNSTGGVVTQILSNNSTTVVAFTQLSLPPPLSLLPTMLGKAYRPRYMRPFACHRHTLFGISLSTGATPDNLQFRHTENAPASVLFTLSELRTTEHSPERATERGWGCCRSPAITNASGNARRG
jgi:hypothetical protein